MSSVTKRDCVSDREYLYRGKGNTLYFLRCSNYGLCAYNSYIVQIILCDLHNHFYWGILHGYVIQCITKTLNVFNWVLLHECEAK